jgi:hypothetical protein
MSIEEDPSFPAWEDSLYQLLSQRDDHFWQDEECRWLIRARTKVHEYGNFRFCELNYVIYVRGVPHFQKLGSSQSFGSTFDSDQQTTQYSVCLWISSLERYTNRSHTIISERYEHYWTTLTKYHNRANFRRACAILLKLRVELDDSIDSIRRTNTNDFDFDGQQL